MRAVGLLTRVTQKKLTVFRRPNLGTRWPQRGLIGKLTLELKYPGVSTTSRIDTIHRARRWKRGYHAVVRARGIQAVAAKVGISLGGASVLPRLLAFLEKM